MRKLIYAMLLFTAGCGHEEPKPRVVETESKFSAPANVHSNALFGSPSDTDFINIRKAATDFVTSSSKGKKVKGITISSSEDRVFLVGVDVSSATEDRAVNLVVREFVTELGVAYWKAEPFSPGLLDAITSQKIKRMSQKNADLHARVFNLEGQVPAEDTDEDFNSTERYR